MDARSWLQKTHTSIRFVYAREHTGYMLYLNHTFVSSLHPPVSCCCQKHRVHKGVLKKLEHAAHTHTHISLFYGFIISFCELSHTFYGLAPDTACHLLTGQNLLADHLPAFVFHNILYDVCEKDEYSTVYTFAFCCGGLHSIWQSVNWLLCVSNWRQEALTLFSLQMVTCFHVWQRASSFCRKPDTCCFSPTKCWFSDIPSSSGSNLFLHTYFKTSNEVRVKFFAGNR